MRAWLTAGRVRLAVTLFLACQTLPPLFFAAAVAWRLDMLGLNGWLPYEELRYTLMHGPAAALADAPLLTLDFSAGYPMTSLYTVTLGQLCFSAAFAVMGAAVWHRSRTMPCRLAAAGGPLSAIGAASTSLLGCCGAGMPGAALALTGIASTTAVHWHHATRLAELGVLALLAARWAWLAMEERRSNTGLYHLQPVNSARGS